MSGSSRGWVIIGLSSLSLSSVWVGPTSCAHSDRAERSQSDASGLAGVQAEIAAREYRASENGAGLQAPNRAHNLRTYFAPDGIRVVDRTRAGSPRLLELSLAGVGRESALRAVPEGTLHADGTRVEIRRPGLVEWFVNDPPGAPLAAEFALAEERRIAVSVDDAGAEYPLVIDPLLTQTADGQLEADQANAELGVASRRRAT